MGRKPSEIRRLPNKTFLLCVEGNTEEMYFEHLQKLINTSPAHQANIQICIYTGISPIVQVEKRFNREGINYLDNLYVVRDFETPDNEKGFVKYGEGFYRFVKEYGDIKKTKAMNIQICLLNCFCFCIRQYSQNPSLDLRIT